MFLDPIADLLCRYCRYDEVMHQGLIRISLQVYRHSWQTEQWPPHAQTAGTTTGHTTEFYNSPVIYHDIYTLTWPPSHVHHRHTVLCVCTHTHAHLLFCAPCPQGCQAASRHLMWFGSHPMHDGWKLSINHVMSVVYRLARPLWTTSIHLRGVLLGGLQFAWGLHFKICRCGQWVGIRWFWSLCKWTAGLTTWVRYFMV